MNRTHATVNRDDVIASLGMACRNGQLDANFILSYINESQDYAIELYGNLDGNTIRNLRSIRECAEIDHVPSLVLLGTTGWQAKYGDKFDHEKILKRAAFLTLSALNKQDTDNLFLIAMLWKIAEYFERFRRHSKVFEAQFRSLKIICAKHHHNYAARLLNLATPQPSPFDGLTGHEASKLVGTFMAEERESSTSRIFHRYPAFLEDCIVNVGDGFLAGGDVRLEDSAEVLYLYAAANRNANGTYRSGCFMTDKLEFTKVSKKHIDFAKGVEYLEEISLLDWPLALKSLSEAYEYGLQRRDVPKTFAPNKTKSQHYKARYDLMVEELGKVELDFDDTAESLFEASVFR